MMKRVRYGRVINFNLSIGGSNPSYITKLNGVQANLVEAWV